MVKKQKPLRTYMMIHKTIRLAIVELFSIIVLGMFHFNSTLLTVFLWVFFIGIPLIFLVKDIYKTYTHKSPKMDSMITLNEYIQNYAFISTSTDN